VRRACIDIGSNTTRLLVADCRGRRLAPIREEREFTRVLQARKPDGTIAEAKLAEVAETVAAQRAAALAVGARSVDVVATAAMRNAANGAVLIETVRRRCGLLVRILDEREEARLAFLGAACTLAHTPADPLAVIDVGGGSTEVAIGAAPDTVRFSASLPLGSGLLVHDFLVGDPPSSEELDRARARVAAALERFALPPCAEAVAVGGSATSLRRLTGGRLTRGVLDRLLTLLLEGPSAALAGRLGLDSDRVRVLPGGLLIMRELSERLGPALEIGRGGLREGVLLAAGPA
jgi:exopolyphosphatase/guanosine-5'-triphosphate,3'-diphosphate pyrophosphatase